MASLESVLFSVTLVSLMVALDAHGVMSHPPQRGCLQGRSDFCTKIYDNDAPTDWSMHFPAGDKSPAPGSGGHSQRKAAGPEGWTLFEPLKPGYHWRSGVCGDLRNGQGKHMRNGEYYHGGMISETYTQGSVVNIDLSIVGYHNGFVEFHICDVSKCGGEISESCFHTPGACHQLQRERTEECQNGANSRCGPIDREHPGRWYLPCPLHYDGTKIQSFGSNELRYRLPSDFHCEHCVMQWYWATGNTCNAPGLEDYYLGPDKPVGWGDCEGESEAKGGYVDYLSKCGGDRFAEEYLQCADIRIIFNGDNGDHTVTTSPSVSVSTTTTVATTVETSTSISPELSSTTRPSVTSTSTAVSTKFQNDDWMNDDEYKTCAKYSRVKGQKGTYGRIQDIVLIADGCRFLSLHQYPVVDISEFSWVAIEAVTQRRVKRVRFFINGEGVSTSGPAPFLMNHGRWDDPIVNRPFTIEVSGEGDTDSISVTLRK